MDDRKFVVTYEDGCKTEHLIGDCTVLIKDPKQHVVRIDCIEGVCSWRAECDSDYWSASCGNSWVMIDGTPEESNVRFCPGCGRPCRSVPRNEHLFDEETEQDV